MADAPDVGTMDFEKEVARLQALVKTSLAISTITSLDELLLVIMGEITRALDADRSTLFLYDEETDELWSKIAQGMDLAEIRIKSDQGIAGHVFKSGKSVNIADAVHDSRQMKKVDSTTGYVTKTLLCVRLDNKDGNPIGVIQVLNKKGDGAFSADDERLLSALAVHVSISIENTRLYHELKEMFDSFIAACAKTIDARDTLTAHHSAHVAMYSVAVARNLHFDKEEIEVLRYASLLHDFGKIGVRDHILCKPGPLTPDEYSAMKGHAQYTKDLLGKIKFNRQYRPIPKVAGGHHEKLDGSGYPDGVAGDKIPLGTRIISVSDVFDSLTTPRHYRQPMPDPDAIAILEKGRIKEFDPDCIDSLKLYCHRKRAPLPGFDDAEVQKSLDAKYKPLSETKKLLMTI